MDLCKGRSFWVNEGKDIDVQVFVPGPQRVYATARDKQNRLLAAKIGVEPVGREGVNIVLRPADPKKVTTVTVRSIDTSSPACRLAGVP